MVLETDTARARPATLTFYIEAGYSDSDNGALTHEKH